MSSVSALQIKQKTLCTQTILWACRADPGLNVLTGYYGVYHSILGPTAGQVLFVNKKVFFFSDRYKTLPNRFFYNKKHSTGYIGRLDMIIGSRYNHTRILTMGSGGHFENCLW